MLAISLGYPLGTEKENFIIQADNQFKKISFREAVVWAMFNGIKEIQSLNSDDVYFYELVKKGLIIKADTLVELLDLLRDKTIIRQGAASLNNGKNMVFLGERCIEISGVIGWIWFLADGKKSVKDILSTLEQRISISEKDVIIALSYLDENDLIFLL